MMKQYIATMMAAAAIFLFGCNSEGAGTSAASIKGSDSGYTFTPEQLELSPEELAKALPKPTNWSEFFDMSWDLTNIKGEEYRDAYEGLHEARLDQEYKQREMQAITMFVREGVKVQTTIKVDPVAYAQLMAAASQPDGTTLETGLDFRPGQDAVLINYGLPDQKPAVTITYNVTSLLRQFGETVSRFDPSVEEDEIQEVVDKWTQTRFDIVEQLAQQ